MRAQRIDAPFQRSVGSGQRELPRVHFAKQIQFDALQFQRRVVGVADEGINA